MKDNVAAGPKAPTPVMGPPQFASVDVEAFSKNLARMVEGGGKALAAYLQAARGRPGRARPVRRNRPTWSRRSARCSRYWLSDPSRAVELQSRLGQAYLELFGHGGQADVRRGVQAGGRSPTRRTGASPIRNGRPTSSSTSSSRPICSAPTGPRSWSPTPRASTRIRGRRPSSTSGSSPTRCRRRTSC